MKNRSEKQKESNGKRADISLFTALSSLATTLFFVVFNAYLYAKNGALWNLCISIYYAVLFAIRISVFACKKGVKAGKLDKKKQQTASVAIDVLFLIADMSLIAPIALMAMHKRDVSYSTVIAISSATYTLYKIVVASLNLKKSAKTGNLFDRILRAAGLKDAIMSIIVLQYVLISTFGGGNALDLMCDITNLILWGAIVAVSVIETGLTIKEKKDCKN